MKIYIVGKSTDRIVKSNIREPFFVDIQYNLENINSQNDMYSECVAMYYLWKHCDDTIVGLEHYRRNFFDIFTSELLNETAINLYLAKYDVLMTYPNKDYVKKNLKEDLSQHITDDGFTALLDAIHCLYGNDTFEWFNSYFKTTTKCGFNLFITKKCFFDEYAAWFFPLMSDLSKKINLPKRSFGYISEFLLYGFFVRKQLLIKNVSFIFNFNGHLRINTWGMEIEENYL